MSGASKRANGGANGPVLYSVDFIVILPTVERGPESYCENEHFSERPYYVFTNLAISVVGIRAIHVENHETG